MATIQGVYIALFGRPADPTGLAYFNGVTKNGADLSGIGNLAGQKEYTDRFTGMNNVAIINSIYQSLFGRDAETAGLTFFSNALGTGTLTINNIAIAILDGAQGDDKTIVANKLVAAGQFTTAIDTSIEIQSYVGNSAAALGRAFLAPVTKDVATIPSATATDTAVAGVVTAGQAGVTLSVTDAQAVSLADATHASTDKADTISVTGTYAATSKIDGALGVDTLNVNVAAGITPAAGQLTSIEKIFVTSTNAAGALDLTNVTGVTEVWNKASAFAETISNVATTTAVGLNGAISAATTFVFKDVGGTADAATLVVDGATVTAATTIANIESLTLNVKSASTVSDLQVAAAKTITVTGAGDLTLDVTGAAKATIDASAHTGKFVVSGILDDYTVKGGAGNDTLFADTAASGGVKLTGGAGSDLFHFAAVANLVDTSTNALIVADVNQVTDFDGTTDTLQINTLGTKATLTNTQLSDIAAAATLKDALTVAGAATAALAVNDYVSFVWHGDSYVFHDATGNGLSNNDGVVQLVGFTSALSDANFVHA